MHQLETKNLKYDCYFLMERRNLFVFNFGVKEKKVSVKLIFKMFLPHIFQYFLLPNDTHNITN